MQTIMTKITWLQIFATVFQLITSTSGTCNDTNVGIRDDLKVIPNEKMNASTENGSNFLAEFGRLRATNAWCPFSSDSDPYLQIDLGQKYVICGVEAQGLPGASVRTSFTLSFSNDGSAFTDLNPNQQFDGSEADGDVSDFHELSSTITARYIRFKLTSTSICLRVEVYGTPGGEGGLFPGYVSFIQLCSSSTASFCDRPVRIDLKRSMCFCQRKCRQAVQTSSKSLIGECICSAGVNPGDSRSLAGCRNSKIAIHQQQIDLRTVLSQTIILNQMLTHTLGLKLYTKEGVNVTCNENGIQVSIGSVDGSGSGLGPGSGLGVLSLREDSDSSCQETSDGSIINFDITLGTCGTRVVISADGENAFYRNTITSSTDDTINFEIICSYIREARLLGGGSGEFDFEMGIFTDPDFTTPASGTISLRTTLYFEIKVETFNIDTEIHLTNCRASTSADPEDTAAMSYPFIENGCHVASDSFVTGYDCALTSNTQNFTLAAFRFPGSTDDDLIYFHCQAAVCLTSNADSICKTQCDACPDGSKRKKRGLGHHSRNDLAEENLVLGPYKIIDNGGSDDAVDYRGTNGKEPETIADSEGFPVTMVIIVCVGALVAIAIAIALFVTIRLSQSSRGLAVKDVTVDLARDNLAFNELDVTALSMKSNEKPILS